VVAAADPGSQRLWLSVIRWDSSASPTPHQLLAGSVWTACSRCGGAAGDLDRGGTDDPIIPVVNARIMNALLPHSRLHLHDGGHIDLVQNATELAPVIEKFLAPRAPCTRRVDVLNPEVDASFEPGMQSYNRQVGDAGFEQHVLAQQRVPGVLPRGLVENE